MTWFRREKGRLQAPKDSQIRTEGLWSKCEGCRQIIWKKDLEPTFNVCPKCGHHLRLDARARLRLLFDDEIYSEHDTAVESTDPLKFVDRKPYHERLELAQQST